MVFVVFLYVKINGTFAFISISVVKNLSLIHISGEKVIISGYELFGENERLIIR